MASLKGVAYYRCLPYNRVVTLEQGSGDAAVFIARLEQIPFVRIHGASREEALARLDEVFDDCIQSLIDAGERIPEPIPWPGPGVAMQEPQLQLIDVPVPSSATEYVSGEAVPPWTVAPPGAETVGV